HALAASYQRQHGVGSVNWLVPNAYGPGDASDPDRVHALNGIIIRLLRARKAGERRFEIWGSGRPVREWVYVDDAARVLVQSLEGGPQIDPINLAQKRGHSIAEIAALAATILGYEVELVFNTRYPDGAPSKILDDRRFRERFPDFRFTPIEEGIARTIDYYRSASEDPGGAMDFLHVHVPPWSRELADDVLAPGRLIERRTPRRCPMPWRKSAA